MSARHESHESYHDDCAGCRAEMEASWREHTASWRAERNLRQSLALAREDLDMPDAPEWPDLMDAIQHRLK